MPVANTTHLNEDCSDISDWTDQDVDTGESTQVTFDSKSCFKFDSGASTASPYASRLIDVGSFGNRVVVSLYLYCDAIGTNADNDFFGLVVKKSDVRLTVKFCSDGIFILPAAGTGIEVGTNLVIQDTWQKWTFDIDFTTPASATCDVYLGSNLVGEGIDCSYEIAGTDGEVSLNQYGYATANRISYVDWIKVGDDFMVTVTPRGWDGEISNKPLKRYGMKLLDFSHYKRKRHHISEE